MTATPKPSKPLTFTPPKNIVHQKPSESPAVVESSTHETPFGTILLDAVFQDEDFVRDLKKLQKEVLIGETLGENIKRAPKPEAPRTEKQGPMTHRPFQQFEGLRELQRQLHKNEGEAK
ncbi:hypothetical protein SEA_NAPOLEONB_58 [Arthrobacter phage NapoleonB]|uniref:Uncharacterized protein n=1 Tax=Arthrobacter phage Dynamite TaxID=2867479 RepID=A0AAE8XJU2_9CAUD|nr:hypothetical protein PQB82_gp58 [Arthrobacter phage Dynamite]QFP95026.1 hypothetical protein SEA_NAPOLEONB_58 [Arthrobacter phage NapoleonB]UAW09219.1 hypothetical protein SEA_DYNAMITE_58 [Arthrobacter phage Dynamite]